MTAECDGRYYVDVNARCAGRAAARSLALRIGQLAVAQCEANGTLQATHASEEAISMPAH